MNMQKVSPKTKTLWLIGNLIWLAVITFVMAIALQICWDTPSFTTAAILIGILWPVFAVLLMIWPGLQYKNYGYCWDDKRLCIQSGVIFKHQITAPICQIQDLHFFEGPVMRLMGLGKIMLATGGSNFELTGMDANTAKALIEDLEHKLRARIEVQGHEEI